MAETTQSLLESIRASVRTLQSLEEQVPQLEEICDLVVERLEAGNKVLTAGHGGSAAEALHMAEELVGRFKANRRPLPAVALVADPTLLTCISNDFGFEEVFPRQVEGLGQAGDVLVIFSSSGNGEGFLRAAERARERGVITVGLLGKGGGPLAPRLDHPFVVSGEETARIQEAHTLIMHMILEAVERHFVDG